MKRLLSRMVVIAAVAGLIVLLWVMYRSESRDRRRLEANQRSLLTDVEYYRTRDSLSAAGVERLTLTNREFRRHAEELERTVEDLQLKVRRLQSASRTAVTTAYPVEARYAEPVALCESVGNARRSCCRRPVPWPHRKPRYADSGGSPHSPEVLVYPLGHESRPPGGDYA